jgi:gamma-glutamyltranspeptidase/glutathione hydrolase
LEKNKKLFLVLGSPGGSTIITSVFQTILNSVLFDMDIKSAVNAPRFHHQWKPDKIYMEDELYSDSLKNVLRKIGHQVTKRKSIGHVNAIMIEENNLSIAADKRGDNSGQITSE